MFDSALADSGIAAVLAAFGSPGTSQQTHHPPALLQTFAVTWAQSTFAAAVKPMVGVGNVGQFVQPTIQLPIAERNVPTVTWQPTTVYRPVVQNYRLGKRQAVIAAAFEPSQQQAFMLSCCVCWYAGFCVPRQQWRLDGAFADRCPAQTYLQTLNNQQVW